MWQGVCFLPVHAVEAFEYSGMAALLFIKNGNRHTQYGSAKQNTGRFTGSLRISGKQGQKSFFQIPDRIICCKLLHCPGHQRPGHHTAGAVS